MASRDPYAFRLGLFVISGVVLGTEQINIMMHNTLYTSIW